MSSRRQNFHSQGQGFEVFLQGFRSSIFMKIALKIAKFAPKIKIVKFSRTSQDLRHQVSNAATKAQAVDWGLWLTHVKKMQEISIQAQAQAKTAHAAYMDSIAGLSASNPFPTTLSAFEELKNNPSLYQLKKSLNEIFRQMARCETKFWYTTCFCRDFDRKWHPNVPILRFMA